MVYDALENGAQNYILKPITSEKVVTTLEKVLGNKRDSYRKAKT